MKSLFACICSVIFLLLNGTAYAGWYQITNYQGTIGSYPVHLSLQYYESFGSGLVFRGSYYYDRRQSPIPLYGKYNADGNAELCEVHDKNEFQVMVYGRKEGFDTTGCNLLLTLTSSGAEGIWRNDKTTLEVKLQRTGLLDNTGAEPVISGDIEVPFWGQTSQHSFRGIYTAAEYGLTVSSINVIEKRTGKQVQQLLPHEAGCDFGFLMTPVYMNLEDFTHAGQEQVMLNCYVRGSEEHVVYVFNKQQKKFVMLQ